MPTVELMQISQAAVGTGNVGEAWTGGSAADVGGGLAAEVTVENTGPVGASTTVELLYVPHDKDGVKLDTNGEASLVQDSAHVWKFTPTAGVYGPWRIKMKDGANEEIRIFGIAHPTTGIVEPATGERGDPTADLLSPPLAERIRDSENNEGGTWEGYRRFYRALVERFEALGSGDGDGLALDPTLRSVGFAALPGNIYRIDGTASFTITMPAAPGNNDRIGFIRIGTGGVQTVDFSPKTLVGAAPALPLIVTGQPTMSKLRFSSGDDFWVYDHDLLELLFLGTASNSVLFSDGGNPPVVGITSAGGADRLLGRFAGGDIKFGDPTEARTLLNVEDGANAYVHPNHTGDVTSVGDGPQTIAADAVTNAKLADMAEDTLKGRDTAGTGDPEDLTPAAVRAMLGVDLDGDPRPPEGAAGGDLSGTYPNPTVNDGADSTAIHDNVNNEFGFLGVANPLPADVLLMERAGSGGSKSRVFIGAIPNTPLEVVSVWRHDSDTTDADPGAGDWRANNVTHASATQLFVSHSADLGMSLETWLESFAVGDLLAIVQKHDVTKRHLYSVTGAIVDGTGYAKIPVSSVFGNNLSAAEECTFHHYKISTSGAAGGDLTGAYPNPTLGVGVVDAPQLAGDSVGTAALQGDSVTNAKLADMATQTIKGRTTAGTGNPEDLTAAQVRAILNVLEGAGDSNQISDAPTGQQDDYSPTGWDDCNMLVISPTAALSISSFAKPTTAAKPHRKTIVQGNGNATTILHNDLTGTAGNEVLIAGGGNFVMGAQNDVATIEYDDITDVWRVV